MTKDDFRDYIAAFNALDWDGFSRFYAEDVELRLGQKRVLTSRRQILDFYRDVATKCREQLVVRAIVLDEDGLAAELDTEFKALADVPDFIAGPLVPGQSIFLTSFVHYRIRDGKFSHIQSARAKDPVSAPSTF